MNEPSISEAESTVMQVLWSRGEATADDIVAEVAAPNGWQEATVKTLISRLLKKGAISASPEGRRYRYRAKMRQADWVESKSAWLIDRVYGGKVAPLVAHFSQQGRLSRQDIAELRRLIEDLDDDA